MTHEEFQNRLHDIPDRKLIEEATLQLDKMCKNGAKSFIMTVPPQLTDTDMVFSELIRRFELLIIK